MVGRYLTKIIKTTKTHDTDTTSQDMGIVAEAETRDKMIPIPQRKSPTRETRFGLRGYSDWDIDKLFQNIS